MTIFTTLSHTQLLSPFFMQHPNNSYPRKPWYQRAIEMTTLWKAIKKASEIPMKNVTLRKSISRTREINHTPSNRRKLRKCTSTSFTRACLCAPISSYSEVFHVDVVPPRRSYNYSRSKSLTSRPDQLRSPSARISIQGRKIFRGKSLTDDVLMRRFVIEEEASMQVRRRNEMEIIRRRIGMRRKKIGPSPLSRMVLAKKE